MFFNDYIVTLLNQTFEREKLLSKENKDIKVSLEVSVPNKDTIEKALKNKQDIGVKSEINIKVNPKAEKEEATINLTHIITFKINENYLVNDIDTSIRQETLKIIHPYLKNEINSLCLRANMAPINLPVFNESN